MDYSQINLNYLIETVLCFSYTPNNLLQITKRHLGSPSISNDVNQISHEITPLRDETKKYPMSLASPMELDKEANLEQVQVITTIEHGIIEDLFTLLTIREHPKPNLTIGSDQRIRFPPPNELSLFGENISMLNSVFQVAFEQVKVTS